MSCKAYLLCLMVALGSGAVHARDVVIAATDWEPFTSETLYDGGVLIEIAVAALQRTGHAPRVEIMPWKRALDGTVEGSFTALAGASFTEERTRHLLYPQHFFPTDISLFAASDRARTYEALEDLCPATVGILRGSFVAELLEAAPCLEQEPGNDVLTNVRKLVRGRVDLVAESGPSVRFYANRDMPQARALIRELSPPLVRDRVFVVFSRAAPGHEQLARDYDRGVALIREDGTYDRMLERYGLGP